MTWYDNFTKLYHKNVPSFKRGEYAAALWTGFGHHLPTTPVLDAMELMFDSEGDLVPAMPSSLFDDELKQGVMRWLQKFNPPGQTPTLHSDSICEVLDIRSVHVKIRPDASPDPNHVLFKNYNQRSVSMDTFVPGGIAKWNVGSNNGLAMLLKRELDKTKVDDPQNPTKYRMIFADVNIFERLMKVHISKHITLWFMLLHHHSIGVLRS